jgi:4'-phosphopantetheinyl transferase
MADLECLLNPCERERRDRFRQDADRQRYQLGRALLRLVLAAWLDCDPESPAFRYGPQGKPELVGPGPASPHFNLAHSGDLVLLGLHPRCPVGVDVERHRPQLEWEPLARRVLPAPELQALERLPAAQRSAAFLAAWCRLEARLKASGEGLTGLRPLPAHGLPARGLPARLWPVAVPSGYTAAVALESAP